MPAKGVTIDVTAKKDDGTNTVFFTSSVISTTAVSDFTITDTPGFNAWLKVKVTVTSKTKATNTWSGS